MKKHERIASLVESLDAGPRAGLDPRYAGYFACFNAARYYEAHDVLEDLWLETRDGDALFFKGLIQVAGAFVHLQKHYLHPDHAKHVRRLGPAGRLLQLALTSLAAYPATHRQLDLQAVRGLCRDLAAQLAASGDQRNPWHPDRAPQIHLLPG